MNPVSTTYSVAPLNEIKFPKIYLCPLNVVDRRKIQNNFRKVYVERLNKFFGLGASLASNIEQFLFKINANYDITLFRVLKLM
uniref:Uncharacterized protein n=1 Tax=Romanomermis culicivorax TaxID=13658 RepID=A0A915L3E5_ROMCU